MAYINSKKFVSDGPASSSDSITITASKLYCLPVPAPVEGFVRRVAVEQLTGASVGYTVDVLDSVVPFPAGLGDDTLAAASPLNVYKIIPTETKTAGQDVLVITEAAYKNADSTYAAPSEYVYVVITPGSSTVTTTWSVGVVVEKSISG